MSRARFRSRRLSQKDLDALSNHPSVWKALTAVTKDAQQTARATAPSSRVAASVFNHRKPMGESGPAWIEVRAGSVEGAASPASPAFPAAMIELGTATVDPHPFLYPAVEQAVRKVGGHMTGGPGNHEGS